MGLNKNEAMKLVNSDIATGTHDNLTGNSICIQCLVSIFIDIFDPKNKIGIEENNQVNLLEFIN